MTPGSIQNAESDIRQARESLRAAESLLDLGLRADAASRLYYAAFHATRAVLTLHDKYAKTHSGQLTLFNEVFGGVPSLSVWFAQRQDADYGRGEFTVPLETLRSQLPEVRALVERRAEIAAAAVAAGPDEPDPPPDL